MKKPDWFELTDNDDRGLRVVNRIPYFVFIVIAILLAAIAFLFPSYNSKETPTPSPTTEIILENPTVIDGPSPKTEIKNPSIGVMPSSNTEDDEDQEEEDEEDDD